jgi:biotin carboxyl carrier protein
MANRSLLSAALNRLVLLALAGAMLMTSLVVAPSPAGAAAAPMASVEEASFERIANLDELTSDHARVFRLYWAFFGRSPDVKGAVYWISQRDACVSLDAISDSFAASTEFEARYGPLSDGDFLDLIYRNVLERPGDPEGLAYWADLLGRGVLTRGGVVLNVSLSGEFAARHPYPSDHVPARSCHRPDGTPTGRSIDVIDTSIGRALTTVAGLTIMVPSSLIERAGFHQSSHPGALAMEAVDPAPVRVTTMGSRGRGTVATGAIDIVTEPNTPITAPITGTVARAGNYTLYCKYRDGYVVINPDARPDLEVKLLHIQNVAVSPGDRVEAGDVIASSATTFPFRSQIDALTAEPSWPHVHIEVVDPSIPRKPSSSRC